jgi:hypothetical protein
VKESRQIKSCTLRFAVFFSKKKEAGKKSKTLNLNLNFIYERWKKSVESSAISLSNLSNQPKIRRRLLLLQNIRSPEFAANLKRKFWYGHSKFAKNRKIENLSSA